MTNLELLNNLVEVDGLSIAGALSALDNIIPNENNAPFDRLGSLIEAVGFKYKGYAPAVETDSVWVALVGPVLNIWKFKDGSFLYMNCLVAYEMSE